MMHKAFKQRVKNGAVRFAVPFFRVPNICWVGFLVMMATSGSVFAQYNAQANRVLEMQQLRQEIAELRGMLERQQYRIQQLERARSGVPIQEGATMQESAANYRERRVNSETVQNSRISRSQSGIGESQSAGSVAANDQSMGDNPEAAGYAPVVDLSIVGEPMNSDQPVDTPTNSSIGIPQQSPSGSVGQPQTISNPTMRSDRIAEPVVATGSVGVIGIPQDTASSVDDRQSVGSPQVGEQTQSSTLGQSSSEAEGASAVKVTAISAVLSEQEYYKQGFELLKQFKYDEAVDVFKAQIDQYPTGSLADDGHYWIAESMYLNRNLTESKKYFRAIIDNFTQSPRLPDAMLKTAYIEQERGNEIEARILLQEIIQFHPRSDAAISAKNRLDKLR